MDKEDVMTVLRCLIDTVDRTTSLDNVYNDGWDGDFDDQGYPTGRDPAPEYQESVTWSQVLDVYEFLNALPSLGPKRYREDGIYHRKGI